ncbi:DNA-binding MurR/RpiR family transcriptional regulator [Breznakia sp. PF5-3]|uniref:MurR/RpiR family transcriptional regulator n=1 Tax=unclassified Breznakia TaxID=2623764 RepID=UPI0024055C59|nr:MULTISPECIES: MurR/RpiR family transcriptional regulator [unclassified Breznakia]MDF9825413.1 DNA-binding MurR/RpiR family transcriptional regulator [Breznakia sp. PM6-1]MDF9836291.1 DNA-binding MurR/RpiR family transcriptional regulator [Breznakia sp. PF5-3]MDF9838715.1 DNA-binding MurR/RpiR family transcriptional regulator [Breznakia sp. PFB2-8]MDF9860746.1 DNA-binding MurR/RpiR family transcriptional regulator [Breznakia sp. PH5-24]
MFRAEEIRSLNELELEVYNYITKHREEVLSMKIRELADAAHVSTTTVLRFCKKVGCDGYAEFKVRYKMELSKSEDIHDYNDIHLMLEYFKRIDSEDFDEQLNVAAEMIREQHKVIFLGIGTSGILGKYGARFFSNIGKFSQHIDDPFYPIPTGYYDDSVIIVLSVSGETEQTIDQIHQFKNTNSAIISITNTGTNTIAKMSDLNLSYYVPMDVVGDAINLTTQIPVLFMIETIAKKVKQLSKESV